MTKPLAETSPSTRGRILAALYLVVIIGGITAQAFISDRLVVRDDAAKTATNILANTSLYRLGFTIFMLEMVAQVVVSAMYYDLLKRISGTSRCFFELSGATNSTIGSYQIDYVNFRPNRATKWDSTPKDAAGHQVWTHLSWVRARRFWAAPRVRAWCSGCAFQTPVRPRWVP